MNRSTENTSNKDRLLYGGRIGLTQYTNISDENYRWNYTPAMVYAAYRNNKAASLGELIDHFDLFQNYPDIKSIPVYFNNEKENSGSVEGLDNIFLKKLSDCKIIINLNLTYYEQHGTEFRTIESDEPDLAKESILLHELQHVLQAKHNRPRGTSRLESGREGDAEMASLRNRRVLGILTEKEIGLLDFYETIENSGLLYHYFYYYDKGEMQARKAVRHWLKSLGITYIDPLKEYFGMDIMASGGPIKKEIISGNFELPKSHHPFLKVPKGGSNCGNCKFLTSDKKHCGNALFVKWYGTDLLPTPVNRYCSDWYEPAPEYLAKGGLVTPNKTGKAVMPINPERWEKKRQHIEQMANSIRGLRGTVTRDLKGDDDKTRLTALVVAIIDKTSERVGNEGSEDAGHLGVTGFKKRNITIIGNKIHLKYTGKSGVDHEKSFSDALIAKTLKRAIKDSPKKRVFVTKDGLSIWATQVNRYLVEYNITAKDLRGFNANRFIIEKLNKQQVPNEAKHRKILFRKALRHSAEKVGHKPLTLQKHYLMPELQTEYVSNGRILDLSQFHSGGDINDGRSGGLLVGETDKDGHEGIVAATPDREVILGGGELILTEDTAKSDNIHEFDGKEMTPCEIASELNQQGGGVSIPCNINGNTTDINMEAGGSIESENKDLTLHDNKKIRDMEKEKLGQHHIDVGTIITDNLSNIKNEVIEIMPDGLKLKQMVSIGTPVETFISYDAIEEMFIKNGITISGYDPADYKILHLLIDNKKKDNDIYAKGGQISGYEEMKSGNLIEPKFSKDRYMRTGGKVEGKVKIKDIKIHWAEGPTDYVEKFPKTYTSWAEVNTDLIPILEKDQLGYNKAKFTVLFVDGEAYEGRLDISPTEDNPSITTNVIGEHINFHLSYLLSPKSGTTEETKKEAKEWLEKYDLESDAEKEVVPEMPTLQQIKDSISGLEVLAETGKNKQELIDSIEGLKVLVELMPDKMETGGSISAKDYIENKTRQEPLEYKYSIIRKRADDIPSDSDIESVLNALIDAGISDNELKTKLTKTGAQYLKVKDEKVKELESKIKKYYKGSMDASYIPLILITLVDSATRFNDNIIEKYKNKSHKKGGEIYESGGKLGFKKLSKKIAKNYVGKDVPKEYQSQYGKTYSKEEALHVGQATAAVIEREKGQLA